MFLIHVERMVENDRMNRKRKYISCLFAIMVASLPLRNNFNDNNNNSVPSSQIHSRQPASHTPPMSYKNSYYHSNRRISSQSDIYSTFSENSLSRHASISSADSRSTYSTANTNTTSSREALSITDYFPHIKILPNNLLVHTDPRQKSGTNSSFLQQKALLQNLNPSSSNKFKMRAVFTSLLCCNWLVGYCTVASNDEAESIMTEFLNLGWITFYDEKYRHYDQVESSKSIALRLTGTGMKVVIDVSLEQYSDFQQQQQQQKREQAMNSNIDKLDKRYSVASSSSSHHTDSTLSSSILTNFEEIGIISHSPLPSLKHTSSVKSSNSFTPIHNTPQQYDGSNYFDVNPTSLITAPFFENNNKVHFGSTLAYTNNTPPLTPTTPTCENNNSNKESNSIKLKAILKDVDFRSLFRDFLVVNLCVENLDFWIEHNNLRRNCQNSPEVLAMMSSVKQQRLLQDAYILWDTYLCPGASRELNIDHTLREDMAEEISHMVTLVNTGSGNTSVPTVIISTSSAYESLLTILNWFDRVNGQICRLMAADSIPKFIRTVEYKKAANTHLHEEEQQYTTIVTNSDLDDFPPPPQRKLKETLFL